MRRFFVDTNVLIDFLADREPFATDAARLFDLSHKKKIQLYVSAVSYNNIYYILRQSLTHSATSKILGELNEWTHVIDVTVGVIRKSLTSEFKDFEDAIQYNCAKSLSTIEAFITRDTSDYKKNSLPVLTPKEAVSLIVGVK
jgi:predicted nucleic acid-binding protein